MPCYRNKRSGMSHFLRNMFKEGNVKVKKGFALVEVIMATIIIAITTTAVYSVVLSSFVSGQKADKREVAAMLLKKAQNALQTYVAVENSNNVYTLPGGPSGRWAADSSGRWALAAGNHDISSLLLNTPLKGGTFIYRVTNFNCGMGTSDRLACKRVRFTLTYPDAVGI